VCENQFAQHSEKGKSLQLEHLETPHLIVTTSMQLPFSTSGLFVARMIGFHENTTSAEKENILLKSLFDFELNNYLWTLNTIFGTCFVKSPDFERLSGTMELEVQHQFLKLLCQKVTILSQLIGKDSFDCFS
jgi:hypothetical protein